MMNKRIKTVFLGITLLAASTAYADQAISTEEMLGYCEDQGGAAITCEIYAQAVYDTHLVLVATAELPSIICVQQPAPTRQAVIQAYVTWAKADVQLADQPAAQTMLRFMAQRFPC